MKKAEHDAVVAWARAGIVGCVFLGLFMFASFAPESDARSADGRVAEDSSKDAARTGIVDFLFGDRDQDFGVNGMQTPPPPTPVTTVDRAIESFYAGFTGQSVAGTDYLDGGDAGVVIGAADGNSVDEYNFLPTPTIFNSIACVAPVPTSGAIAGCGSRDNDVLLELQDGNAGPPTLDVRPDLSSAGFDAAFTCSVRDNGGWVIGGVQGPHAFCAVGHFGGAFTDFIINVTPQAESFSGHVVDETAGVAFFGGTAGSTGLLCKVDLPTVTPVSIFGPNGDGCLRVDIGQVSTTVTDVALLNNRNVVVTGTAEDNDRTRAYVAGFDRLSGGPSPDFLPFSEDIPTSTSSEGWGLDVLVDNGASSGVASGIVRMAEPPAENSDILLMYFNDKGPIGQFNHDFQGAVFRAANPTDVDVFFPPPADPDSEIPRVGVGGNSNNFTTPYFARFFGQIPGTVFVDGFESGDVSAWSTSAP